LTVRENGHQKQVKLLKAPDDRDGRKKAEAIAIQHIATHVGAIFVEKDHRDDENCHCTAIFLRPPDDLCFGSRHWESRRLAIRSFVTYSRPDFSSALPLAELTRIVATRYSRFLVRQHKSRRLYCVSRPLTVH
jgi:hypothetical protein